MGKAILETIGLTKDFRRRRAVDNLNLQVSEGSVYGFLGPNGAGKSSTIRMLTGLVKPTSGTAKALGWNVMSQRVKALESVGALVESPAFYKYLSGRQNLQILSKLSGGCDEKRIDKILDTVGLLDRAKDKVKAYSHGMVQRLGIAQALLPDPKLVILDEPTSGLDPQGMKDVRDLILRLAKENGMTVFLSSHLLNEVEQICDHVGVINNGKLIAQGSVDKLVRPEIDLVEFRVSDTEKAVETVNPLDWAEIVESDNSLTLKMPPDRANEINRMLVTSGVEVSAITHKTLTLEELFLKLVKEVEC